MLAAAEHKGNFCKRICRQRKNLWFDTLTIPCEVESTKLMTYYVYILRTSSNTLYIGQTNNLEKRIKEHKNKTSKSAKYIRYFKSFKLVYSKKHSTRKEAVKREAQIKQWPKAKKEVLIKEDL